MSVVDDHQKGTHKMHNCDSIFKYTRYSLLVAGTYDIRNEKNTSLLYKIWSFLSQACLFLFIFSCSVGIMKDVLMGERDEVSLDRLNITMQTYLLNILVLLKLLLSYTRGIRDKIRDVYQFEYDIAKDGMECTRIYNRNSRYNYKIFFLTFILVCANGGLYMFGAINEWKLINVGNSTESKSLIFSSWFPFDLGIPTYFNAAYFFQVLMGILDPMFVLSFDSLLYSMVNFAIARAAILGYKLRHLKMYSDGGSESSFHGLRNIVMEHKDLIKYVEEANESLKWYFLGEFIVKSYHISVSISNVMHSNKNIMYFLVFILHLLIQVGLVYTRANELSLKSTNLSVEIFKSNWYEQSSKVKRSLLIVMARAQRPLVFTIGNFRVIDIEMFVNMTKAAYTFVLYQKM